MSRLCTDRERKKEVREREREREYNKFIKFKIIKCPVCVPPNVDGPKWYDYNITERVLLFIYHIRISTILMLI